LGKNYFIADGDLLAENTVVEPESIYIGVPAKKIGKANKKQVEELILKTADNFIKYAEWYREDEKRV